MAAHDAEFRRIIEPHAAAVKQGDVDAMLADFADDVVTFDVVDPLRRLGRGSVPFNPETGQASLGLEP